MKFLNGCKTHILMVAAFVLGCLDQFKVIDLRSTLVDLGVPADRAGFLVAAFAVAGIVLRQMQPVGSDQKPS